MTTVSHVPSPAHPATPAPVHWHAPAMAPEQEAVPPPPRRRRWWQRPATDPRWARPALFALLAATALLYLWGLGASGWANSYYSAAAQAGSVSWKAFLFGSSDAANSITVDKTPLSLWPMALAVRMFGLSSWSILVPQALQGVAAVGLLYLTVKRWFGAAAGLLAAAVLAITPVAVLMFRFNNPEAMLVLLMVASTYFLVRALEDGRNRWLVASGAMLGLGFLAKELQAFLILPVLGGTYLLAGPPRVAKRIVQMVWLGLATLVAGGWWVAVVSLWPASDRPWFGGSQDNTFWNVLLGYNGLGRLTGNEAGSVIPGGGAGGGGGGGVGAWGPTGITRMFNDAFGGQASWLIPAALLVLVAGLVWTLRRPRTDRTRAALLLWGGWLVLSMLVFSLSQGIIHEYYTVALAPAIGALVGIGAIEAWRRRAHPAARSLIAAGVAITSVWSCVLLSRTPTWMPWLRWCVLVVGLGIAIGVLAGGHLLSTPARRWSTVAVVSTLLVVALAGPAAYAVETATSSDTGSLPLAGPLDRAAVRGPGGGPGGGPGMGPGGVPGGVPGGGIGAAGGPPPVGMPPGQIPGQIPGQVPGQVPDGTAAQPPAAQPGQVPGGAGSRGGGLLEGSEPGAEITALLAENAEDFDWVAATVGANSAAGYQLATEDPVMPIGGFNGSDPSPTLEQFQAYVADGRIHYFIAGGGPGGGGRDGRDRGTGSEITQWVQEHFSASTVDGVTVYDLTAGLG